MKAHRSFLPVLQVKRNNHMITTRIALCLASLFVLILAGCEDTPNSPADKKATLVASAWKTTSFTLDGVDMTTTAQSPTTFKSDGTYTARNPDGTTENGTWTFNVDETSIAMTEGGVTVDWSILTLTSSSLHLQGNILGKVADWKGVPE